MGLRVDPGEAPDLFGEIAVSRADLELWITIVARLPPESPRRAAYARAWNVPEKIQAAKAAGCWPPQSPF